MDGWLLIMWIFTFSKVKTGKTMDLKTMIINYNEKQTNNQII